MSNDINEVKLRGQLTTFLPERESERVQFRITVKRDDVPGRGPLYDVIDCAVTGKRATMSVDTWRAGDVVEVEGVLRRRFFTPPGGGRAGRLEVDVRHARLIRRQA